MELFVVCNLKLISKRSPFHVMQVITFLKMHIVICGYSDLRHCNMDEL